MHIHNEVIAGCPDAVSQTTEIGQRPAGRKQQRLRQMRIVPDEVSVFLFDQEVNAAVRKTGTQRANKR